MKVAIVHDWLTGMRGGERCLETFLSIYPQADVYTLIHVPGATSELIDSRVARVSFLNGLPGVIRYYRALLPLFPAATRRLRLRDNYDLVISLSHAAAKNIEVPSRAKHICYCFTPMRYIWDQGQSYFGKALPALWPLITSLRRWDCEGSAGVDRFVAISNFVAARIRRYYGRDATVIFPPVRTDWIAPAEPKRTDRAFLYAGALVPYKRVELIVESFVRSGLNLWVVGSGPLEKALRQCSGPHIRFFGRVSDEELASLYARCRALIFAAREDFGMIPIECLAAGRPVIACYDGALRESMNGICPWKPGSFDFSRASGVFFQSPRLKTPRFDLLEALRFFLQHEDRFRSESCVQHAGDFSPERFTGQWQATVDDVFSNTQRVLSVGNNAQAEATAI